MGLLRPDSPTTRGRDREVVQRRLAQLAGQLGGQPGGQPAGQLGGQPGAEPGPERPPGRHRAAGLSAPERAAGAGADQLAPSVRYRAADRGVTGQHVAVVGLVVAALVTAAAWWVLDARPQTRVATPQPVAPSATGPAAVPPTGPATSLSTPPGAGTDPAAPSGAAPTAVPTAGPAEGTVVVDVTGKVRRPGLVSLPAGSRVADALESAGGARPRVDLSTLNLARLLVDGEQILVGERAASWPAPVPTATSTVPGEPGVPVAPVNLNTATMPELETLPGVGPVTAQAILDWRATNGGFSTVDELLEVDGIGEITLADLRDLVTV